MTDQPATGPSTSGASSARRVPPSAAIRYQEQLRTPWWWYLAGVVIALLLGGEFATAIPTWIAWIPFALVLAVAVLAVWRFSSGRVTVTEDELLAGDRAVPLAAIERAIALSPTELRRLVGRHSDPSAFTFVRSWVGPGVQLVLAPPPPGRAPERADQFTDGAPAPTATPYWAVSTRHPDRLLDALAAASVPVR